MSPLITRIFMEITLIQLWHSKLQFNKPLKIWKHKLFIILYLTHHHALVLKEEDLSEMQEFLQLVMQPFPAIIVVNHQYKDVHSDLTMLKDVNVLFVISTEDSLLLTFLIFKENQKFTDLIFLRKTKRINLIFVVDVKKEEQSLMKISKKLMVHVGKDFS